MWGNLLQNLRDSSSSPLTPSCPWLCSFITYVFHLKKERRKKKKENPSDLWKFKHQNYYLWYFSKLLILLESFQLIFVLETFIILRLAKSLKYSEGKEPENFLSFAIWIRPPVSQTSEFINRGLQHQRRSWNWNLHLQNKENKMRMKSLLVLTVSIKISGY